MKAPNLDPKPDHGQPTLSPLMESISQEKPLYTGRFILTLREETSPTEGLKEILSTKAGMRVASDQDFENEPITEEGLSQADAIVYEDFKIAVIGAEDEQVATLEQNAMDYVMEPEQIMYVPNPSTQAATAATYGLQLTHVTNSPFTGAGIRVAVLDTGMDLNHPDFQGRTVYHQSFISGQSVQDGHGHGTHCIGTACGNIASNGVRYGVAKDSEIFVGKVLSDQGNGAQMGIINGIRWAIQNECKVVSMSLGSAIYPGMSYNRAYERVASIALSRNVLVIAAAGNESNRHHGVFNPVGSPANCPSILAVGAIDSQYQMASFSNRSINPDGQIDMVAPGVGVDSSWPMPQRYNSISGTSMATPHVAGIAALYQQKYPNYDAAHIWWKMSLDARRMLHPSADVGVGLAMAPQ